MPQPGRNLRGLSSGEPDFELPLQHVSRASVARYSA
jgi:hypothetical protein